MSNLDNKIAELTTEVSEETTVMQSAVTLINGFEARVQAAIEAALAAGATEAQLAQMTALKTDLNTGGEALAEAVAANTPPPAP